MGNKVTPEFFLSSYYKENPNVAKKVKSGKINCPFGESSISGLTNRFRKKVMPKGAIPKGVYQEEVKKCL